ncbi:hypothetical protein BJV82DRAFT_682206 [Fennellomyces sp. T-0311]|nr:hypothetical protein BJV82DRAFT_682206 [Fennellomyces sp. T-0311]
MQPIFFYYEAGKFYYRETPNAMEEDTSECATAESEDVSSEADDYVWTLSVRNGYTPERVGKFTEAIKNGGTKVLPAAKSNRIGKSKAYKLRDMIEDNPDVVPGWKSRAEVLSVDLSTEQKFFIAEFVEKHGPRIIWKEAANALNEEYQEQPVTNNVVKTYLLENHAFSLGILECPSVSENEQGIVREARMKYVRALQGSTDKYLFFDGCTLSKTTVTVATTRPKKQKSFSVQLDSFVCLNAAGILAFSQEAVIPPKLKKLPNFERQGSAQGTRVDHFRQFVDNVIHMLKESKQQHT